MKVIDFTIISKTSPFFDKSVNFEQNELKQYFYEVTNLLMFIKHLL